MTREEFETIIRIIDNEVSTKDLEDLKKIKGYLDKKLSGVEETYLDITSCYEILTMRLEDFLRENIRNRSFKKVNFLITIKEITKAESYREIYVFDTIGMKKSRLLKKGISENALGIYEEALEYHGIEREKSIKTEEREELNKLKKREHMKYKRK